MAKRSPAKASEQRSPDFTPEHRIVLFRGKDANLRMVWTEKLRKFLVSAHGDVGVFRYDGKECGVADVLDDCRSMGLLEPHKLVVVDNAAEWVKGESRPMIERYAEAPVDSATLVLRSETWHRGKLDERIAANGCLVNCDPPGRTMAVNSLIKKGNQELGVTLARDAAERMVDQMGLDTGRLAMELEKLATAAGPGGTIGVDLVRELTGVTREEQIWDLQHEILSRDPERALAKLHELLHVSRLPMQLVRWSCMDLARKLHGVTGAMKAGMAIPPVAKALKLWGQTQDAVVAAARSLDHADAQELLNEAVRADRHAKTGHGDEVRTLERLILRFTSALK